MNEENKPISNAGSGLPPGSTASYGASGPIGTSGPTSGGSGTSGYSSGGTGEHLKQKAQETKQSAHQQAEGLKSAAQEQGKAALDQAKAGASSLAHEAQAFGRKFVDQQRTALADRVEEYAEAARAASSRLQEDDDLLARPTEQAASQLSRASRYLRDKQPSDLLQDLEGLARRRPEVVFGGMFVAGLAAARFLKASSRSVGYGRHQSGTAGYAGSDYSSTPSGIPSSGGLSATGTTTGGTGLSSTGTGGSYGSGVGSTGVGPSGAGSTGAGSSSGTGTSKVMPADSAADLPGPPSLPHKPSPSPLMP